MDRISIRAELEINFYQGNFIGYAAPRVEWVAKDLLRRKFYGLDYP